MAKIFSAFVGLGLLGAVGAASAAEPVALTDTQMDSVTAGIVVTSGPYLLVRTQGNLNSTTGLNATFQSETYFVTSLGGNNGNN